MLPFTYAVRNLFRSKSRLLQTIGGSATVVLLVMTSVAINSGMKRVLSASGSDRNVILVGAGSEESIQRSEVPERTAGIAEAGVPGISETLGVRAVSSEIQYMNYLTFPDGRKSQAMLRGVTLQALRVHPEVRLVEGNFPAAGEVMVGRLAWLPSTISISGANFLSKSSGTPRKVITSSDAPQLLTTICTGITSRTPAIRRISSA